MSNNERAKLLPGYTDTADAVEENGKKLDDLKEQLSETNALLSSLNKYHGNPESETGYLKQSVDILDCIKRGHNKRHSAGVKISIATAFVIVMVAVIESLTKGEASWVVGFARFLKGFL